MSVNLETKLLSHNFSRKTNRRICFSILMTRKYLKLEIEFHPMNQKFWFSKMKLDFQNMYWYREFRSFGHNPIKFSYSMIFCVFIKFFCRCLTPSDSKRMILETLNSKSCPQNAPKFFMKITYMYDNS